MALNVKSKKIYGYCMIVFAVFMMMSSALISYFYVKKNEQHLFSLKMEEENKQFFIRDIWNNISNQENRANTMVLISILSVKENKNAVEIKNLYMKEFPTLNNDSSLLDILDAVENEKKSDIEKINSLYLEQISIERQIENIERTNNLYANIAIFLQVLGLVLIMLKKEIFP